MVEKVTVLFVNKTKRRGKYPDGGNLYLQVRRSARNVETGTVTKSLLFRYSRFGKDTWLGRSHLSNAPMMKVLKRLGRTGITVHGFRSTFRHRCAESTNYPAGVAEMALAHALRDKTEAAYRRGDLSVFLTELGVASTVVTTV